MIDVEVRHTVKNLSITFLRSGRLHYLVQDEVDVRLVHVIFHHSLLQLLNTLFQGLIHGSVVKKVG